MENTSPVVMLCRNSLELTKRAVESVLNQDVPVRLYLIDNCSSDGTDSWANEQGKDVLVFRFCPPLGVSAGWNFGLSEAFRRRDHAAMKSAFDSDHAFVINNDVILRSDCLRELLADGGPFVTGVGVDTIEAIGGGFLKSVRPHPDFSCFMIRREVWEKVGLFDERMVLYASDADYHVRMHQAGIHAYTIGMPFYHYASGTLKTASGYEKQRIQEQADRDRAVFERKYGCQIGSPEYNAMFEEKVTG